METLKEKARNHFKNLDKKKFEQDWINVIASSCSSGFSLDDLIESQKKFKYSIEEVVPDKSKFNFNNLLENPSFNSDSLFLHYEQLCSIRF